MEDECLDVRSFVGWGKQSANAAKELHASLALRLPHPTKDKKPDNYLFSVLRPKDTPIVTPEQSLPTKTRFLGVSDCSVSGITFFRVKFTFLGHFSAFCPNFHLRTQQPPKFKNCYTVSTLYSW